MKINTYIPEYRRQFFKYENCFDIFVSELILQLVREGHEIVDEDETSDVSLIFNHVGQKRDGKPSILTIDDSIMPELIKYDSDTDKLNSDAFLENFQNADGVIYRSNLIRNFIHQAVGEKKKEFIIPGGFNIDSLKTSNNLFQTPQGGDLVSEKTWLYVNILGSENGLRESFIYFDKNAPSDSILLVMGEPEEERWSAIKDLKELDFFNENRFVQLGNPGERDVLSSLKTCETYINLSCFPYYSDLAIIASIYGSHIICSDMTVEREIFGNNCTVIQNSTIILDEDFKNNHLVPYDGSTPTLEEVGIESVCKKYISAIDSILI